MRHLQQALPVPVQHILLLTPRPLPADIWLHRFRNGITPDCCILVCEVAPHTSPTRICIQCRQPQPPCQNKAQPYSRRHACSCVHPAQLHPCSPSYVYNLNLNFSLNPSHHETPASQPPPNPLPPYC